MKGVELFDEFNCTRTCNKSYIYISCDVVNFEDIAYHTILGIKNLLSFNITNFVVNKSNQYADICCAVIEYFKKFNSNINYECINFELEILYKNAWCLVIDDLGNRTYQPNTKILQPRTK